MNKESEILENIKKRIQTNMSKLSQSPTTSGMNARESGDHPRYAAVTEPTPASVTAKGEKFNATPEQGQRISPNEAAPSYNNALGFGVNDAPVEMGPVKVVDFKTITGSYAGDHRAQARDAIMPDNPAPRSDMAQAPSSKFDSSVATEKTVTPTESLGG